MDLTMLTRALRSLLLPAAITTFSSLSLASSYGFNCITSGAAGDCAIGEANLHVDVSAGPQANQVTFTFTNSDPNGSSLADVYFDDGSLLGIHDISGSSGVSFSQSAAPGSLPGGNNIDWNSSRDFSADSDAPVYHNGVNSPTE